MVRCEAMLFDLDGVLVDSIVVVERHWKLWAEQYGYDWKEILQHAHGMRTAETIQRVAPHLDVDKEVEFIATGEAADTDGLRVYDGVKELLHALPKSCWTVATSGSRAIATTRLRYAELPIPEHLVTADDVQRGKPNPDPYLLAAKKLGKNPERCLVIEDAPAGVTAAKAAGAFVIAVSTTHHESELQHADVITGKLANIDVQVVQKENGEMELEVNVKQPALSV